MKSGKNAGAGATDIGIATIMVITVKAIMATVKAMEDRIEKATIGRIIGKLINIE